MWRPVRYASALAVGVGVSVAVASVSNRDVLVTVTLAPLYAVVTSLVLVAVERSRGDGVIPGEEGSSRTTAAAVGGVGGGVGTALLNVSVPVGVAAYGLLFLGIVSTVLQIAASRES